MSYQNPLDMTGPRERPSVVTNAAYLLFAAAGLYLVNLIIGLATASKSINAAKDVIAQNQTTSTHVDAAVKVGIFVGIGFDVVVLVVFVLMAVFVMRGSNAWRITTFVIAGLAVLCSFCGLAGSGLSKLNTGNSLTTAQQDELKNAVPAWAKDGQIAVSLLIVIALIVAIILLTRPAANAFFRKQGQMMVPNAPYPAYPPVQSPGQPPQQSQAPQDQADGTSADGSWTPPSA